MGVNSAMALSQNIKEIYIAVLDIAQFELVLVPEFPGTTRYIWALQEMG